MAVLILLAVLVCTAAGYVVGKLVPKHWSAYLVTLVLGPITGVAAFWVVGYLTTGSDNLVPGFIAHGTGQSFWVGLLFAPFGAFLSRQRTKTIKGDAAEVESISSPTRLANGKSVTRPRVRTY